MHDARDLDATGLEVDDEKHEIANQSTGGKHFHGEEIRRSYSTPMGFQKSAPGSAFVPRGCGLDTVFRENAFHGVSAKLMAHVCESPTNPRIAPA